MTRHDNPTTEEKKRQVRREEKKGRVQIMGINYNRIAQIATLSRNIDKDGITWSNELNIISWNNGVPVFDIREWDESHNKCRLGVKLSADEMKQLVNGFSKYAKEVELI